MTISGGLVSDTNGYIGNNTNSSGTATVSSGTWTNARGLYVGSSGTGALNVNTGGVVTSGSIIVGNSSGGNGTLTISGGLVSSTTGYLSFNTNSSGTATVSSGTWANSDTLSIGEAGTGAVTVSGGVVTGANAIYVGNSGTGTLNVTNSGVVSVGNGTGQLVLANSAGSVGTLNLGQGGTAGTLNTASVSGGAGTATVNINQNGSYTFAPAMSGTLNLNIIGGGGTTTLTGSSNFTGATTVDNAALNVDTGGVVASSTFMVGNSGTGTLNVTNSGVVSVGDGTGQLVLANSAGSVGTLNLGQGGTAGVLQAASVTAGSGTATVNFNHTGSYTFAPQLSGSLSGSLSVNQLSGVTVLTGSNTYTGATTISNGTLTLGSGGSIASSTVVTVGTSAGSTAKFDVSGVTGGTYSVASGQTLKGGGTVVGNISVGTGAILAPGNSPGTLTVNGNASYGAGGTYQWEINNATGTKGTDPGWDWNNITGTLDITATSSSGSKFIIDIRGLNALNAAGQVVNWNASGTYSWVIASASTAITGFSADKFTLQTDNFVNNNTISGTGFSLTQSGKDLVLNYVGALPNDSALSLNPTSVTIKTFVTKTTGTSSTLSNTQSNGASTDYTLTPSNNGITASAGGTLNAGANTQVNVALVNNANGSATSGNKSYTVTAANTGNTSDVSKTLTVNAAIYQEAQLSVGVTAATQATAAELSLTNAASSDSGQRAGVTVTSLTPSDSATGASSNFVAPTNGTLATGDTTTSDSTQTIATVALKDKRLNGSYSETVTAAVQYTDSALRSQVASLADKTYALTATVSGNKSSSESDVYSADILKGQGFAGYGIQSGVGKGTVATLVGGTANAATTVTVTMSMTNALPLGTADNKYMSSDILTLGGMNASDLFVLEMTYSDNTNVLAGLPYYIGWWDASLNQWVNAIADNGSGNQSFEGIDALNESYAVWSGTASNPLQLGAFGYKDGKAWAVLNHKGKFVVIPEPSTWAMLAGGLGVLGLVQRLRRRAKACF